MYLRILKKDLKRKKTMNVILLIFIILAATFIASSAANMVSIMTAIDSYCEKAEVPDYWFATVDSESRDRFEDFAKDHNYDYKVTDLIQVDLKDIHLTNGEFDYSNTVSLSSLNHSTRIFDDSDNEITEVNDGEIYITVLVADSLKDDLKKGDTIRLTVCGKTKEFTLKGYTKDALFGSPMVGMTRMLISENDFANFHNEQDALVYSIVVYTDDAQFNEEWNDLELNTIFNVDKSAIKKLYIMDVLIAAVMLIVSVCLILISMVILRFTINFTMSEEFREIGVMKAIGIPNRQIRGLYIAKYFAISVVGAVIGLVLSIPFGNLMEANFSRNIIMPGNSLLPLNILCALAAAAIVVLFCYFCTRKIKAFSPIDAIRNGENGERYGQKSIIRLGRTNFSPVSFLALNDIFSGLKRYLAMILIFVLGLLLIIIPVNTINTLQSDNLITWFNMAKCDHVISTELILDSGISSYKDWIEENIDDLGQTLHENNIEAKVFQEIIFRMTVFYNDSKTSSLAFQGRGDIATDRYEYLEGTAPQNAGEVAVTPLVARKIGAGIGDTVEIKNGDQTQKYMITALFQSMNNMGEGIRFYQDAPLDFNYAAGCFGMQIQYDDSPDSRELARRKELLEKLYPDNKVFTAGEYIGYMIGDIAGQLQDIKYLILIVVLSINILVTVLMVRSFLAKEKGEIAMLKAIGFQNSALVVWQSMRIGIVLLLSIVIGTFLSTPLSKLLIEPIFQMMGAQNITFQIKPLEVYVMYPLIVLTVTVLAGAFAAMRLKKISASETSNIE